MRSQNGFTLLETVAAIALIAVLAAVLLPAAPRATTRSQLEAYAIEAAALLKSDRNAALRRNAHIRTEVDAAARVIRSGSSGRALRIADDVSFRAMLPLTCSDRPAHATISFFGSGLSCGGTIVLSRLGAGYEVRVNWLTGAVEVVARN